MLTVVIPTRNRAPYLAETLAALADQEDMRGAFEVVVIDDGSTDDTAALLQSERWNVLGLRWQRQDGQGPAVARNRGIALARGERVLLLGDDTRPVPGALVAHPQAAADQEVGVQGHIDWDPNAPITDVMRFLAPAGPQFYFKGLREGETIPFSAVLGSNFSAPTAWFRADPFEEGFPDAALEDTEQAYRFERKGQKSIYTRQALCLHHHHYETLEPFLARQRRAGRAARHAVGLHFGLLWPVIGQPTVFGGWLLARHLLRTLIGQRRQEDSWDLRCRGAFLRGVLEAKVYSRR